MPERNISAFNRDTAKHGGYIYTSVDRWSSRVAVARQTDEIIRLIELNFSRSIGIVDVGCGDGTLTLELARRFRPESIRGIDPAASAVEAATKRIPSHLSERIGFEVDDIYKVRARPGEVLAVARGVLHHLDDPQGAITRLCRHFPAIVALEPNGYSPFLKVIEKVSTYHRLHDEKSYWPPTLSRWFEENGFSVMRQIYFGVVPYFCPTPIARTLKSVEPLFEALPFIREITCGTNLVLYSKGKL
jgi:SAM-dependent methyltransferase